MFTRQDLEHLSRIDKEIIPNHTLKELTEIHIDPNEPLENRIKAFFEGIGNPYCFKINDTVFRIKFSDNSKSLDDSIYNYLSNLVESDN